MACLGRRDALVQTAECAVRNALPPKESSSDLYPNSSGRNQTATTHLGSLPCGIGSVRTITLNVPVRASLTFRRSAIILQSSTLSTNY